MAIYIFYISAIKQTKSKLIILLSSLLLNNLTLCPSYKKKLNLIKKIEKLPR